MLVDATRTRRAPAFVVATAMTTASRIHGATRIKTPVIRALAAATLMLLLAVGPASAQPNRASLWASAGVGYGHTRADRATNFSTAVAAGYLSRPGLFLVRWMEVRELLSEPYVGDLGVLYGTERSAGPMRVSGAAGLAYVYDTWGNQGIGLPLEATLRVHDGGIGLALTAFADVNRIASFWGAHLSILAGRLR